MNYLYYSTFIILYIEYAVFCSISTSQRLHAISIDVDMDLSNAYVL